MGGPPIRQPPHSEACPFCGRVVATRTPRATNVTLSPIHSGTTVAFTAHWECLRPRLAGMGAASGADAFAALFGGDAPAP
jgi:hypothetical protein